jgi:hypothetical protein
MVSTEPFLLRRVWPIVISNEMPELEKSAGLLLFTLGGVSGRSLENGMSEAEGLGIAWHVRMMWEFIAPKTCTSALDLKTCVTITQQTCTNNAKKVVRLLQICVYN